MKQTAVEWLLQRFEDGDMYNIEDTQFIKHQALAMEKEQIMDAHRRVSVGLYTDAEQYYQETYGGNND